MKHYLAPLVALIVICAASPAAAADADALLGLWLTPPSEDGQAHIEFSKQGAKYSGKIVWLEKPVYPPDDEEGMAGQDKVDRENPDSKLRKRPIIGIEVAGGFSFDGEIWKGGTIYDPANGKTYKCKITLMEDGKTIKVRGFIGFSLIGRTEKWTRVEP